MIRLHLLGPPDIRRTDGAELPPALRAAKTVAFLARLALANPDFVRRDQLVGLLWPELDDARARNALSKALHHARRALGDAAFMARGNEEIGLARDAWSVDVWELEGALVAGDVDGALERFGRGTLLEGVHLSDAPDFESWLDGVRARLHSRLLEEVVARADALEGSANPMEALPYLARAGDLAPADEVIVRRRMRLLDRLGDRGGARQAFEQFATRLRRNLELEPSPETVALLASIVDRRELSAPPVGGRSPEAPASAPLPPVTVGEAPSPTAPPGATPSIGENRRDRTPRRPRWPAVVALTAAAAVVLVATLASRRAPTPPVGVGQRVLVAPFANRTGDTAFAQLGEMVADFVAQGIQRADILEVVDPLTSVIASSAAPAGATVAERTLTAATKAGAGTVVTGAFYRRGDSLVFQAEVIDVGRRRRLATADSVVTGAADEVAIATRVREATAGMLATIFDERLASIGAGKAPPPSLAAYREFRRGLELFPHDEVGALPYFHAAARLDPTFVQPLMWASFVYGNAQRFAERDSVLRILAARRERLRGLDRHAADYLIASDLHGRHADALEAARAAAAESPGSNWSHNASNEMLARNRLEEALAYSRQVDPEHGWARGWFPYWKNLTSALHLLGRHEEELREARRGTQMSGEPYVLGFFEVRALLALGRVDEAERRMDEVMRAVPKGTLLVDGLQAMGEEFRTHGHQAAATRAFERAAAIASEVTTLGNRAPAAVAAWARVARAWSLYEMERADAALRALDSLPARDVDPRDAASAAFLRALIAAAPGRDTTNTRALDVVAFDLQQQLSRYQRAQLAAVAGDREGVMRILRETDGDADATMWFHRDREWTALREFAPFRALMTPR